MKDLNITVVHRIPGRLRLRLQRPPKSINKLFGNVSRDGGIESVTFNPITMSLLIHYKPAVVSSTEIIVRVGITLSLDYGNRHVGISQLEQSQFLTAFDYYAAASLLVAYGARLFNLGISSQKILIFNAVFSTLVAVLKHAWAEIKREGIYHPEVISVVYLFNSLIRGNYINASTVTWIATFGRHLMSPARELCLLEASEIKDENDQTYIDVIVRPVYDSRFDNNPLKLLIVGLSGVAGINPKNNHYSISEQIQLMSKKHGNVLEGIDRKLGPVYMRLNN